MGVRILYDHQIFFAQDYGGISRYFTELMGRLDSCGASFSLPRMHTNNYYVRHRIDAGTHGAISHNKPISKIFRRYFSRSNISMSRKMLQDGNFDVFHPTYYDPYFLKHLYGRPFVVTVYDMIHEIFPEYFRPDDPTIARKRELVEKASKIIAISENTKRDIIEFYGTDDDKIEVVYLGNSLKTGGPEKASTSALPDKYLLYVGDRKAYKNFYLLAESLADMLRNDQELYLLSIGGGAFSGGEAVMLKNLGISDKTLQLTAGDDELPSIYRNALAFVCPSLYEGFGIPVLEAFSCDCPAILSNTSSLPEVGGDAATYFDPKDTASIKNAISKVIYDDRIREQMVSKGRTQVKKFSWEKCARETVSAYSSVI